MKIKTFFLFLTMVITSSTISFGQTKAVTDYLKVNKPLAFAGKSFVLSWSSHPSGNYYKQEYLVKGDNLEKFKTMILLEVVTGQSDLKAVVDAKLAELKKIKETNPVVNFEVMESPATGEYMIDFLLTANAADGSISIAERNVYRYRIFTDKKGQKGIQLFAVSERSYGAGITKFLTALKTNRQELVKQVSSFVIPVVSIQ
jgi:hypothetical protein